MPEGSSSAAPVIKPGPRRPKNRRNRCGILSRAFGLGCPVIPVGSGLRRILVLNYGPNLLYVRLSWALSRFVIPTGSLGVGLSGVA